MNNRYEIEIFFRGLGIIYFRRWQESEHLEVEKTDASLFNVATKNFDDLGLSFQTKEKRESFLNLACDSFLEGFRKAEHDVNG